MTLPRVVCFGGAHIDCSAYTVAPVIPGASNPVRRTTSVGGVGRNVAVRLARAGVPVSMVSRVGQDLEGDRVLEDLRAAGVCVDTMQRDPENATAQYTALIEPDGELYVGWADMDVYDAVSAASLACDATSWELAAGWFLDCNLSAPALKWLADTCPKPTWLAADTISPAKAVRLRGLTHQLDYLFCNRQSAAALLGLDSAPPKGELAWQLRKAGVGAAIVTEGPHGIALAFDDQVVELPPPVKVVTGDVTGAGDSLVAGTLAGLAEGVHITQSVLRGLDAARITLGQRGA